MGNRTLDWNVIESLELEIAKALGYKAVLGESRWSIVAPDGHEMYCESQRTEEQAWRSAILHYGPEWARHIDRALSLDMIDPYAFNLTLGSTHITSQIVDTSAMVGDPKRPYVIVRTEFTRPISESAIAICRSWLEWKTKGA